MQIPGTPLMNTAPELLLARPHAPSRRRRPQTPLGPSALLSATLALGTSPLTGQAPAAATEPGSQHDKSTRRALPAPFASPFPMAEYLGTPLIGVPPAHVDFPSTRLFADLLPATKDLGIRANAWSTFSGNLSSSKDSGLPAAYWIVPNSVQMEHSAIRLEREPDTVQTDHVDWGFRTTLTYGTNYRWMTSGGWFEDQLLERNQLYGFEPTEVYFDLYFPGLAQGAVLRTGRWVAPPDIETQFSPENYMGSHSLLFSHSVYTITGMMLTTKMSDNLSVQTGVHAGTDMAPWYEGARVAALLGFRYVSDDNNDALHVQATSLNDPEFQRFDVNGQPAGHDNFNTVNVTWQHRVDQDVHTSTQAYAIWQRDAVVGGRVNIGPVRSFGGGGGIGADIDGMTWTYGILNYSMVKLTPTSFFTLRNEWWRDEDGARSAKPGSYTSHAVGFTLLPWSNVIVRPEFAYYRNWDNPAFDLQRSQGHWHLGLDVTFRF